MSTIDTPLFYDVCFVVFYLYGLDRTLAYTFIAVLAVVRFGVNRSEVESLVPSFEFCEDRDCRYSLVLPELFTDWRDLFLYMFCHQYIELDLHYTYLRISVLKMLFLHLSYSLQYIYVLLPDVCCSLWKNMNFQDKF